MCAVRNQLRQRFVPGADVLLGNLGNRHHLIVHALLVLRDRPNGQEIINTQLGFGNTADIAGHDRHTVQHGLHDDARSCFCPQRRNQQHAGASQERGDLVNRRQHRNVGVLLERVAVGFVRTP